MQYRKVGRTGLKISAAALGTGFSARTPVKLTRTRSWMWLFEKGINLFDTANSYAGGKSKRSWGNSSKTKGLRSCWRPRWGKNRAPEPNDGGLSREHILQGVEASLKRMDTSYIDIYYALYLITRRRWKRHCGLRRSGGNRESPLYCLR